MTDIPTSKAVYDRYTVAERLDIESLPVEAAPDCQTCALLHPGASLKAVVRLKHPLVPPPLEVCLDHGQEFLDAWACVGLAGQYEVLAAYGVLHVGEVEDGSGRIEIVVQDPSEPTFEVRRETGPTGPFGRRVELAPVGISLVLPTTALRLRETKR